MPRIPKEASDQIERGEAGGGNRKAIEGYVLAKLIEAKESEPKDSGYAGQDLKFEVILPREHKGTWVWEYISYHPNATGMWEEFFDAFGYEYTSDTDEIVEDEAAVVILDCSIEQYAKGKRKGEDKTTVGGYLDPENEENRALVGE